MAVRNLSGSVLVGVMLATKAPEASAQSRFDTEIAKAMMAEAIVRACPVDFQRVGALSKRQRKLLTAYANWSEREIAKKAAELRTAGCDAVGIMYTRLRSRYPYIRPVRTKR